jgi:Flp pilus assembly pilin Flp
LIAPIVALPHLAARGCRRSERGSSLVEYALLVALIAVACIMALTAFSDSNGGSMNNSAEKIVTAVR